MVRYQRDEKPKKTTKQNQLLSTINPNLKVKAQTRLKTNTVHSNNVARTKLRSKRRVIVYIKDDKFYIDHAAAFDLKLINVRAIMTENEYLVEVGSETLSKFQNSEEIEIEYQKIGKEKESEREDLADTLLKPKRKVIVYTKEDKFYIDHAAAFALKLINVRAIMTENRHLVEVESETLSKFQNSEDIEIEYQEFNEEKENKERKEVNNLEKKKNVRKILLADNQKGKNLSDTTKKKRTRDILLDLCTKAKLSDLSNAKEILKEGTQKRKESYKGKEV